MNLRIIFILLVFVSAFSDFPPAHSIQFSTLLYRFSYSEEFNNYFPNYVDRVIGRPRSDEYGATAGGEISYNFLHKKSNFTLGFKFNYSSAINHTYDGSFQGEYLFINYPDTINGYLVPNSKDYLALVYEPHKEKNKDNFFYGMNAKLGYLVNKTNGRIMFEPKILYTFNIWNRPVGFTEIYYWMHISPAISLATKNRENLGILTEIGLLVPIWERMILINGPYKDKLEIGGKVGWNFDFGFAKYLKQNSAIKITYFYENYGFKESPAVYVSWIGNILEPSSSTHNHGVKLTFEKGFGG